MSAVHLGVPSPRPQAISYQDVTSREALEVREDVGPESLKAPLCVRYPSACPFSPPSPTRMGVAAMPVAIAAGSVFAGFENAW